MRTFLFLTLIGLTFLLSSQSMACDDTQQCIEEGEWSVGLAIGTGIQTNPLVGGDNIPQVVLLDIAWYSNAFYFDNGELGYKWFEDEHFTISSYVNLDRERALFYFWDPANILVNTGATTISGEDIKVSIDDIEPRDWALLAGSRFDYYFNSQKFSISVESDISGTHGGYRTELSYRKAWQQNNWRFQIQPFLLYKSDKLVDYYYGLGDPNVLSPTIIYEGTGGVEHGISLFYSYQLDEQWQFIANSTYKKLGSGVRKSPLVENDYQSSLFIGFGYRF